MISGFRDDWLRAFFVDDVRSRNIPSDLEIRLFRKLQMLDDATTDQDLRVPPSNHFEKLRGKLEGFHSIRVNSQWRLIFRWDGRRGEASGVYIDDHSIAEVFHVDDEAQAGDCRRNSDSGIHGADGSYAGRVGKGHGSAAQARQ